MVFGFSEAPRAVSEGPETIDTTSICYTDTIRPVLVLQYGFHYFEVGVIFGKQVDRDFLVGSYQVGVGTFVRVRFDLPRTRCKDQITQPHAMSNILNRHVPAQVAIGRVACESTQHLFLVAPLHVLMLGPYLTEK